MFADTGIDRPEVAALIEAFPEQAIDFFGAIKSRAYDAQVRDLIQAMGLEQISKRLATNPAAAQLGRPDFRIETLRGIGAELLAEQRHIQELHLARQYNPQHDQPQHAPQQFPAEATGSGSTGSGSTGSGFTQFPLDRPPQPPAPAARSPLGDWHGERRSPQSNGTSLPVPSEHHPVERALHHTQTVTSGNNGGKFDANWSSTLVLAPPPPASLYRHGRFLTAPAAASPPPVQPMSTTDAGPLPAAVRSPLESLLAQGCRVGLEFATPRQFRANAWRCWGTVDPEPAATAIAQVAACLAEHPHAYIRLVAIDPHRKQRLREIIIQRP
jgi:ribulose bisphosphate carboxylase small subunit